MGLPIKIDYVLNEKDLDVQATKGSGPGGQLRNKISSAIRMTHKPTGLKVFICNERSQHQNRSTALNILSARVKQFYDEKQQSQYDRTRFNQIGNRSRSNKVRTYNFKENRVVDHNLGTKTSKINEIMNGNFDLILPL